MATEIKGYIQGRHPHHQQYWSSRASSQLAGAIISHIQPIKYLRSSLLWQHFGGELHNQSQIKFLPISRTSPPLPRHAHRCNTNFTHHNCQHSRQIQWHGRPFLLRLSKRKLFAANKNLTEYFQTYFPLPNGHYWTKLTLPLNWTHQVILCLIGEQLMLRSLLMLPRISKSTRRHGNNIPPHGTLTPSSKAVTSLTSSFLSQLFLHGSGKDNTARAFKSRFQQLLRWYRPSPRPST